MNNTQQKQKQKDLNNFFLKGKRVSEPIPFTDNYSEKGYKFDMEVKQNYQTNSFANLTISVNVPKNIWDNFTGNGEESEWLEISGLLTSEYTTVDDKQLLVYMMYAKQICRFDTSLYELVGGECYFSGSAKVVTLKNYQHNSSQKGINVARLHLRPNSKYFSKDFEVLALRSKVNMLKAQNINEDSLISIVAYLMPSTNKNGEGKPPYFSLREVLKREVVEQEKIFV